LVAVYIFSSTHSRQWANVLRADAVW